MNKKNNQRWSALLVTIMMTSIVLLVAIVLLERIIPYSKQIRNMQDSLQAYYTARWETEIGKLNFQKMSGKIRIPTAPPPANSERRINMGNETRIQGWNPVVIKTPELRKDLLSEYVLIAGDYKLPLRIKLFENDETIRGFGTNRGDPLSHLLSSFSGGMMLDLSGVDTDASFSLNLLTEPGFSGKIPVEFIYSGTTGENPFFGSIDIDSSGTTDLMSARDNSWLIELSGKSWWFLAGQNCENANCYMKIRLAESLANSIGIQLETNNGIMIPDLNAVLIADGISNNWLYHSRIIELIPMTQSI